MKRQKYYIYLSNEEVSIVLHSLIRFKNSLLAQGKHTGFVDEVILKVMYAPVKKIKIA